MGGIAEFGMHFVGNRALILGDGLPELQIIYSVGFTVLSFFIPVIGLFLAFSGLGEPQTASITRVALAGLFAAMGVCIMHYLGQAGISNYTCVYYFAYFLGAGIIAVAAEIAALMILCKFRSSNAVWKRLLTAAVLAAALTGLHWLAEVGTEYQLKPVNGSQGMYEGYSIIPVIVLVCWILTPLDDVLTCQGPLCICYPSAGIITYLDSNKNSCQKSTTGRISDCSLRPRWQAYGYSRRNATKPEDYKRLP